MIVRFIKPVPFLLSLLILQIVSFHSHAQDLQYARAVVDTMGAPGMHGRGYVKSGDKIAASFISSEFRKLGLKSFGQSHTQEFTMPVNTFPGAMSLSVNGIPLVAGRDFIVNPASAPTFTSAQNVPLVWADSLAAADKKKRKKMAKANEFSAFIVDEPNKGAASAQLALGKFSPAQLKYVPLIVTLKDKLTWSVAGEPDRSMNLGVEVLRSAMPKNARQVSFDIRSEFVKEYQTQNVIGYIEGSQKPDSFLVFSAHYDHLGRMGAATYFPGANDNSSGIAMLLNLAKHYSLPANKPKYSVVFIAFGAEEAGLVGSKFYTENPLFDMKKIKFLLNMDIMGTGDEGITVVNATENKTEFDKLVELNKQGNYLALVKPRGKAANSDHYFFTEKGVKAFFIYTMGGIKAYHDVHDRPQTLPLTEFEDCFRLITSFTGYLMN